MTGTSASVSGTHREIESATPAASTGARRARTRIARLLLGPAVAALICGAFISVLLLQGGATLKPSAVALLILGLWVSAGAGEAMVARLAPTPFAGRLLLGLVAGYGAAVLVLLVGVFLAGADVATSFSAWSVIAAALLGWRVLKAGGRTAGEEAGADAPPVADLLILAASAAVVAFACRDVAAAVPTIAASGYLPAWIDYYIHGALIAQFGALRPPPGDILFAGIPLPFYHYGMFLPAALVERLFAVSGLAVACGFLLPFGLLLALAGSLALALVLAGPRAAVMALALLLLASLAGIPGIGHPFFDFHWMLFTAPGAGYGLALVAAAVILGERAQRDGAKALAAAGAATLLLVQIRAHIFVLFAPPFLLALVLTQPALRRWRAILLGAAALGLAGIALMLAFSPHWRESLLSLAGGPQFLRNMVSDLDDTLGYRAIFGAPAGWPAPFGTLAQAGLLLPPLLGWLWLALPVAYGLQRLLAPPDPALRRAVLLLGLALLVQWLLFAIAPSGPQGDVSEYAQRAFVVPVMLALVLLAALLARISEALVPRTPFRALRFAVGLALAGAGPLLLAEAQGHDPARSRLSWGEALYRPPVDPGVLALADFARAHTQAGDVIAVAPADAKAALVDQGTILASLTDRAIYLTTPALQEAVGGARAEEARHHFARLQEMEAAPSAEARSASMKAAGVALLVLTGPAGAGEGSAPAFANAYGRVFLPAEATRVAPDATLGAIRPAPRASPGEGG